MTKYPRPGKMGPTPREVDEAAKYASLHPIPKSGAAADHAAPADDSAAALELAKLLSERGIASVLTPRFRLLGRPVTVEAAAPENADCPHLDWGYDEGGEAYCHDCERVVPISSVPRRDPVEAKKLAAQLDGIRKRRRPSHDG